MFVGGRLVEHAKHSVLRTGSSYLVVTQNYSKQQHVLSNEAHQRRLSKNQLTDTVWRGGTGKSSNSEVQYPEEDVDIFHVKLGKVLMCCRTIGHVSKQRIIYPGSTNSWPFALFQCSCYIQNCG